MNQEINVELTVFGEEDVLVFHLNDEEKENEFVVHLNSDESQADLKNVFLEIINVLKNGLVHLNLTITQNYSKVLYKDVFTEYIDDLNNEISQTYEEMKNQNLIFSGD